MIAFADIVIGRGGELRCAACARVAGETRVESARLDEVRDAIARAAGEWADGPGPNVAFVGFEPFAHPRLPDMITAAVDAGCERVRLRTDGGALAQRGNAEGVLRAGVRQFEIVLLGADAEHDRLTGKPGLAAAATEGARAVIGGARAMGARVALTGLVRVCRHNAPHAAAAVARLAAMGAVGVCLDAADMRAEDRPHLEAALDTAATSAVAGWVVGLDGEVASPWASAPWRTL